MKTEIVLVNEQNIRKAAALLQSGAVVAFPTETVYGLGANGLNAAAVSRIFDAKGRPQDNPLILHVADPSGFEPLVTKVSDEAQKLMDAFWPGPLTIVLEASGLVPPEPRAGLPTVAVRCPEHPWARRLIDACGFPLAAPSANQSGRPSPTTAEAVFEDMDGRIPMILDGGPCGIGLESTVLTLAAGKPRVLRPGGVTPAQIEAVLGSVEVDEASLKALAPGAKAASPGMMYRHYAPKARLTVVAGKDAAAAAKICALYDEAKAVGGNPAVLAPAGCEIRYGGRAVIALGRAGDVQSIGAALFEALREVDLEGRTDVFAQAVEPEGFGLAVMNRLLRAAGFRLVEV